MNALYCLTAALLVGCASDGVDQGTSSVQQCIANLIQKNASGISVGGLRNSMPIAVVHKNCRKYSYYFECPTGCANIGMTVDADQKGTSIGYTKLLLPRLGFEETARNWSSLLDLLSRKLGAPPVNRIAFQFASQKDVKAADRACVSWPDGDNVLMLSAYAGAEDRLLALSIVNAPASMLCESDAAETDTAEH